MTAADITLDSVRAMCPVRPENGHKGTFGMVLIAAGSKDMPGAQVLAVSAALRSGAGKVRVFAPEDSLGPVTVNCPCAILAPWGETVSSTIRAYNRLSGETRACAIGPGLDEKDDRSRGLLEVMISTAPSLVIDAGALNIISRDRSHYMSLIRKRTGDGLAPAVLTPHPGELARLWSEGAENCAIENKCIVVAKDHHTVIYDTEGNAFRNNSAGNSGMAKGGSGDVLTGLIAGLLAQGMKPVDAAVSGVFIHATAGDIAAEVIGKRSMLPTDIIDYLGEAFFAVGWEESV